MRRRAARPHGAGGRDHRARVRGKVGELVAFGAQASDAGSGLGSGYEWSYGDNTAAGSGESVNHTFTQAGTYEVRVKTADAAGNAGDGDEGRSP